MKLKLYSLILAALGCAVSLNAADKIVGGPKGGRLLETAAPKTEFLVNAERKVEIHFYDAALKPSAPAGEAVTVIAEPKTGRTPVELEKTAFGWVSKKPLPEGETYRVVVQIREKPEAKPQNFRLELNLEICGGCSRAEYACTCGH